MKQYITVEQLNELSEKDKENLSYWFTEKRYKNSSLMTIGQMIEFLDEDEFYNFISIVEDGINWTVWLEYGELVKEKVGLTQENICDALFEAVKRVLKR